MQGSAKQIAWAEQIKAEALAAFAALRDKSPEPGRTVVVAVIAELERQEDAAWWIDNRIALGSPQQWVMGAVVERGEAIGAPPALIEQARAADRKARENVRRAGKTQIVP